MSENAGGSRRRLLQQTALAASAAAFASKSRAQTSAQSNASGGDEPAWKRLFPPGFRNERIKTSGAEINTVVGGSGPPVLMFHGAPQSLITWRLIAPDLAKEYTLVMCDLRGYGDSSKPDDGVNHANHSKRAMALDGVEVMQHLGYERFRMVGHDRGGRVGRRMALEHTDRLIKLAVMDIVPAHYLYSHVNLDFVQAYFHWFNYLRKPPGPEDEVKAMNQAFLARATNDIQREYLRTAATPENIHAMCEDYRASASIDLGYDAEDIKAGKKIQCPVLTLWAANGAMGRLYDVLAIWKEEGVNVSGKGLPGNHSLQESAPMETLAELQQFLRG
jgi:haloacetate dehalogenase